VEGLIAILIHNLVLVGYPAEALVLIRTVIVWNLGSDSRPHISRLPSSIEHFCWFCIWTSNGWCLKIMNAKIGD